MLSSVIPLALALSVTRLDFSLTVPLVFAVAAATFCPLLVLGIWWRGLTAPGAIAGVLVGGVMSVAATGISMFAALPANWIGVLLYRPALVAVPLAFLTMIIGSLLTRRADPGRRRQRPVAAARPGAARAQSRSCRTRGRSE